MLSTLRELITWKDLLGQLILKQLRLPYRKTQLGFFWIFALPLALSGIYYFVFSHLLRFEVEGVPFFLYLISGIFPWQFVQLSVSQGARSLLDNKHLIRESQLPHPVIPLAIVLANAIMFLPALGFLVVAGAWVGGGVTFYLLLLPWCFLALVLLAAGGAILASIGSLAWRDLPYGLDLFLTILFYWTPIVYPAKLALDVLAPLYSFMYVVNPFFGLVAIFRTALIPGFEAHLPDQVSMAFLLGTTTAFAFCFFFMALAIYQKSRSWLNDALSY